MNYKIDHVKKAIYAKMALLTEKEKKAIKNYKDIYNYPIIDWIKEKKPIDVYKTKKVIEAFLDLEENKEYKEIYDKKANEQVSKNNEPQFLKDGTPKLKGHVAGLAEFLKHKTDYPTAEDKKIIKEKCAEALEQAKAKIKEAEEKKKNKK